MKVYNHLDEFSGVLNPAVTIGIFDGVHLGHRKILMRLMESAAEIKGQSVILSFNPHPRMVLQQGPEEVRLLNTMEEKQELLASIGIDHLIIHPFDKSFSEIPPDIFVKEILVDKLNTKRLVIGHDHRFGKDRKGSFSILQDDSLRYGFELEEIPALDLKNVSISSSRIRLALTTGEMDTAREFLGYEYFLHGKVVTGNKIGRKINFPTANIKVDDLSKLIPGEGVYAVKVYVKNKLYTGMLNIGKRPTLHGEQLSIEVHILNFNEEIYGEAIQVNFVKRIRDEVRFDDLSSLEAQLRKDRETVKTILE